MATKHTRRDRKVYGLRKQLEISRSLLPSSARQTFRRELAQVRRASRRATAQHLAGLTGPADAVLDAFVDDPTDVGFSPDHEIRETVRDRRGADKVGPFLAWATATTRHLPRDQLIDALRPALPRGVIGDHALTHLERHEPLAPDHAHLRYPWWRRPFDPREGRPPTLDQATAAVRRCYERGGHADLNRALKASPDWAGLESSNLEPPDSTSPDLVPVVRLLAGVHDIDAFTRWHWTRRRYQTWPPFRRHTARQWQALATALVPYRRS